MIITKVTYTPNESDKPSPLLASCSVYLDSTLVIHGVNILEGEKGPYILMPQRSKKRYDKRTDSVYESKVEVCHPISRDFHDYMKKTVLNGWLNYVENDKRDYHPR